MPVEFEEPEFTQSDPMQQERRGVVTDLMFKIGLAKTPGQANLVMLIIAVVAAGLAIYLVLPSRGPALPAGPIMPGQPTGQELPR
jgi:hypothetical protein